MCPVPFSSGEVKIGKDADRLCPRDQAGCGCSRSHQLTQEVLPQGRTQLENGCCVARTLLCAQGGRFETKDQVVLTREDGGMCR